MVLRMIQNVPEQGGGQNRGGQLNAFGVHPGGTYDLSYEDNIVVLTCMFGGFRLSVGSVF